MDRDKEVIIFNENNYNINVISKISSRISDCTSEYISARLLIEINYIAGQIYQLWHKYIELIRYFPQQTNFILQNDYNLNQKEK